MDKETARNYTEANLTKELYELKNNYMKVYDEYYATFSRDSAFLKDLVDSILGICAVLEVYARDGKIYPDYVLEKLSFSKSYIESVMEYYKNKEEKLKGEEDV